MRPGSPALRRAAVLSVAALAFLLLRHVFAIYVSLGRGLDVDEAQYLHVGWLLAHGRRLYRDFVEDHAPFLFVILKWLVPGGTPSMPRVDVVTYAVRGRIVAGACGVLALGSMGTLVYRAVRTVSAPLIATAVLLASPWFWNHGLADIRNDPPTLFLFWLGALLLLGRWRPERWRLVLAGTGIGLAAAAALWNPKTPFESIVLGAIYLSIVGGAMRRGLKDLALAAVPAFGIVAGTIGLIAVRVPLRDYLFFTFRFNTIIGEWFRTRAYVTNLFFAEGRPFLFCDPAFRGAWPILAGTAAATILLVRPLRRTLDVRVYGSLIALAVAALLDIRFIFPWPNLWPQYYLTWDFVLAALYGVTIAATLRAVSSESVRATLQIALAVLVVLLTDPVLPSRQIAASRYPWSWLQKQLRRGETVWVAADVHPVGADDASYYWFAFNDLVPAALQYTAAHPEASPLRQMTEADLPPCRAERGLMPELRFVCNSRTLVSLPVVRGCLERLAAEKRAVPTPVRGVWDLHPGEPSGR